MWHSLAYRGIEVESLRSPGSLIGARFNLGDLSRFKKWVGEATLGVIFSAKRTGHFVPLRSRCTSCAALRLYMCSLRI